MSYNLYSKKGLKLPYLLDTDIERWIEDNREKTKYVQKWVVLQTEANTFVNALSTSYNGKALTSTSREDRGAMCIITVTYGDANFTNNNGEQEWWSVSGGLYTRHRSKWVENNPTSIKAFCASCISQATYKDGCSVSCNPQSGESMVLCEATWQDKPNDNNDDDEEDNPEGGDGGDGGDGGNTEQPTTKESGKSVQFSSSTESITIDFEQLKKKHPKILANPDVLKIITLMENGSVSWQDKNGEIVTKAGWYKVSNNNLALKEGPVIDNEKITPELVGEIKRLLDNPPTFTFPVIRCSVTNKVESSDRMSIQGMVGDLSGVGGKTTSISAGGAVVKAPELTPLNVVGIEGMQFKTSWIYEGASYDNGNSYSKAVDGKTRFVGEVTKSYRTVTELA